MKEFLRKSTSAMLSLATIFMYASTASAAGLLTVARVTPDNARAGASATFTIEAKTATSAKIGGVRLTFLSTPTGYTIATDAEAGSAVSDVTGMVATGWTVDSSSEASGILNFASADGAAGADVTTGTSISFKVSAVKNPNIVAEASEVPGSNGCVQSSVNNKTGACYVKIQTFAGSTVANWTGSDPVLDETVAAYAIHAGTQVSARVESTLEFSVEGVNSSTAVNGTTTTLTSTPEALDFQTLEVDTPEIMAHDLTVKTNSQNGYTVSARLLTANLTGIYGTDIDPFRVATSGGNNSAAATWGTPLAWDLSGAAQSTGPYGTTSGTETGWFGGSTSDTDVFGVGNVNAEKWAPVQITANTVMSELAPDPGTVKTRIGYIVGVNVNQKADLYTGTLVYNCTPKY